SQRSRRQRAPLYEVDPGETVRSVRDPRCGCPIAPTSESTTSASASCLRYRDQSDLRQKYRGRDIKRATEFGLHLFVWRCAKRIRDDSVEVALCLAITPFVQTPLLLA